ncbi:SPOR domain-containing protein [Pseudomaricurvus sp. HS19]|uniref:SPOR domain-containing protein n=1 Tax=Pseudomaricurvus sp. HS19 TaxID=2692626 RepID=UPI00136F90D1|nr:AAA family ATPase [Pseudomaricurvus sp. HS19]MYM63573.1 AAA family ATPase [Pseudomaricurvus sp. HS19]
MMEQASATHFTHPAEGPDVWVQHFGLRYNPFYNPFAVTGDGSELLEDAFYPGAGREALLEQADQACLSGSGVTIIAGADGSGRSLLCRQLHLILQGEARVAFLQAQLLTSTEQVLQAIAGDLQCAASPEASAGEIMAALRHELQQPGAPLVILIDDAHLLDDSLLGGLMSLLVDTNEGERCLHLLLFGDEDLAARLDSYAPVEVFLQDLLLSPLSIKESADYLQHKWDQAGASQSLPLSPLQLQRLWQRSGGIPGALDRLAESALTQLASEADSRTTLPIAHLFALVALVSILLVAFFYWDKWFESREGMETSAAAGPTVSPDEGARRLVAPVHVPVPAGNADGVKPVPAAEPRVAVAPYQGAAADGDVQVPDSGSAPAPLSATDGETAAAVPAVVEPEVKAEAAPKAVPVYTAAEQKLLAMPAEHLLLQVVAAGAKDSLQAFISRQSNREELLMYEVIRNGKPWYVVVIGSFADRNRADWHRAGLPEEQRKAGPWIRSVADVQAEISQYRGR